jgi:hypothetical protein
MIIMIQEYRKTGIQEVQSLHVLQSYLFLFVLGVKKRGWGAEDGYLAVI